MIDHRWTHRFILFLALFGVIAALCTAAVAQEDPPVAKPDEAEAADATAEEALPPQASPKAFLSSSAVNLDGKAQANGVLILVFEPEGGEAVQVRVNVFKKTHAKKIASALKDQLAFAAGEGYKVKVSGGTRVVIKTKSKKSALFSLRVDQVSVNGVAVMITKK